MSGCNKIKRAIDEAQSPDLLPYETASHIASCAGCNGFAEERRKLRQVLASAARVTVPSNFDVMLRERLRDRTERKAIFWIQRPGFVRFAGVAAALVIAVFAAQSAGLFSKGDPAAPTPQSNIGQVVPLPQGPRTAAVVPQPPRVDVQTREAMPGSQRGRSVISQVRTQRARAITSPRPSAEDATVMLLVGQNGEREVSVPAVSVGAQTLLYGGAGRQGTSGARASF